MAFYEKIIAAFGKSGEEWLKQLPEKLDRIATAHDLSAITPFPNLSYNYVAKAIRNNNSVVLKVGLPGDEFTNEVLALQCFHPDHIAKVYDFNVDEGYYIMETIFPGTTLNEKYPDVRTSVRIFVEQWRRLHVSDSKRSSVTSIKLPSIDTWFHALDNEIIEIPAEWINEAKAAQQRIKNLNNKSILHGDLHHENILWDNQRKFVIIDPKGVIGHAYYDCVQYLLNKNESIEEFAYKLDLLIDEYEFDEDVIVDAIKALGTVFLIWAYKDYDEEARKRYKTIEWIMNRK